MWTRIYALIVKELLAVWRDERSRMVLIMPPLMQLLIFAFAVTLDVKNVPIGILNRDAGIVSHEIISRFRGSPTFSKIFTLHSIQDIADVIDNEKVAVVFHFDEEFSRRLLSGQPVAIQAILDGRKSNTAQIIQGYASRIVDQFNREFAANRGFDQQKILLVNTNWYNPNLVYTWFTVPNLLGVLSMLIALVVTALSVARERELGTFDQLLVSPLRPFEILVGKTLPAIFIGMAEGTVILLAAVFIFQVPLVGSILVLYLSLLVFICSIVGVGLFISSLAQTQQQAILGVFVFMPPAVMLSGFATPVENMPGWLQIATLANPLRHFLVIVKGVFLKAMPLTIAFSHIWPMLIIATLTLTSAAFLFRHRLE